MCSLRRHISVELPLMPTWLGSQTNTTVLPQTVRSWIFSSVSSTSKLSQRRFCIAVRLDRESEKIMNLLQFKPCTGRVVCGLGLGLKHRDVKRTGPCCSIGQKFKKYYCSHYSISLNLFSDRIMCSIKLI